MHFIRNADLQNRLRATTGLFLVAVTSAIPGSAQSLKPPCDPASFLRHVGALSADSMEGRWPGSIGGLRAAKYIAHEFAVAGLKSPGGDYFQPVPMRSRRVATGLLNFLNGAAHTTIANGDSIAFESDLTIPVVADSAEPLFIGYGIHAPQLGWDDFADVVVKGRMLIILSGAPDSAHLRLPWGVNDVRSSDPYKIAMARARGARGVVFLFADHPARSVRLTADRVSGTPLSLVAWLGKDATKSIAAKALAMTTEAMIERATQTQRDARLPGRIAFSVQQEVTNISAPNIIGMIPGRSRDRGTVIFVAHYDHLGVRHSATGRDSIFHGALDNASGVSALICVARAFATGRHDLDRTIVFLATTGEEQQGHLGASWYVDHPTVPLSQIIVVLNIDGVNTIMPTEDFLALPASLSDASATFQTMGSSMGMGTVDRELRARSGLEF